MPKKDQKDSRDKVMAEQERLEAEARVRIADNRSAVSTVAPSDSVSNANNQSGCGASRHTFECDA